MGEKNVLHRAVDPARKVATEHHPQGRRQSEKNPCREDGKGHDVDPVGIEISRPAAPGKEPNHPFLEEGNVLGEALEGGEAIDEDLEEEDGEDVEENHHHLGDKRP